MIKQDEFLGDTVEKLAQRIELRDAYTGVHSRRVTRFAILPGRKLQLSAEEVALARIGTRQFL
jgi:HD-GYP domain-containing protein (c-di-GMP phosphodiesterase class II)